MNNKRLLGMLVLFVFLALPVHASMVSFLLVETGPDSRPSGTQYINVWEGGLMEAFFDAGRIVTNSPILQLETKPVNSLSGPIEVDFNDAVEGGAEYFIVGFLEYRGQGAAAPAEIHLRIYRTDNRRMIYEQRFPVGIGRSSDEEYLNAQDAGRIILSHLD